MNNGQSGFLLVYKPAGITTYDIIRIVKKRTGQRKIGHTGTLDPFAEGIVILLLGQMTRMFDYFSTLEKNYRAFAEFGKKTDTLDVTGTIISESPVPDIETIKSNIHCFTGRIKQQPPDFSAVHVNGKRAYELARNGIKPEIRKKTVHIHSIIINNYENNILDFNISCSSGTYIRSLADDLSQKCGSNAYLLKLIRTSIGNFSLSESKLPHDIGKSDIIGIKKGFEMLGIPVFSADRDVSQKIVYGKELSGENTSGKYPGKIISFFDENGDFLALVDNRNFIMKYIFVSSDVSKKVSDDVSLEKMQYENN